MKKQFQSKAVPKGTRTIWRYLSALILLFSLSIGQMWAAEPVESVGNYSTRVISADGTSSTWTFILPSSQVSVPAAGATDNDIVFAPSSGSNMKFSSSNQFSWKGQSDGYIPVPNGSAGTISMTLKSSADSRYLQLYVGGSAAADSKRLWSKYNATPTSDGKKGPQSFSFTADDITTEGGKTYLHFRDNNTEMKIATFTVTLTTGNYLSSGPVDPTITFNDGAYTIGGADLDLSTLFSSNSSGEVTYSVKTDGGTSASIDGTSFTASAAGTCVVTASQAAVSGTYNAKAVDANIVVSAPVPVSSVAVTAPVDGNTYYVGDQVTLAATVLPANATNKTLNWTMDVSDKATIADGKITFTEAGDFHLTASATDGSGKSNKVHLYVSNPTLITSIALDYNEQHINVGDVITITPTILPATATNKNLLWSVTEGATITQEGVLTAVVQSDVIVTAEAQDGSGKSATTHIYIDPLPACATLTPATSGSAIAAGDAIDLQESAPNASMKALTANLSYTENGLLFGENSSTKVEVTLTHLMKEGTVITATIYNADASKARGLNLLNSAGTSKATWTKTQTGDHVETYTVVAGDGLAGSNVFQLQRNNNAYLKDISIANCGAELFALTSAIYPVEADGKATITLSKSLVAAGATATATYSAIDAAYDFDEWVISGATIDNAKANPVTITMGSADAVVTLKLKAASVKHTVTYYDGETELGTELVVEGENPTATGIAAPKKIGYTFAGWSITNGGDATALSGISVAADMPLYAVYNAVNCSALSGTIFSLILNNAPAANCTIKNASGFDQEADLIKYGTVSGGIALAKNSSTSNHIVITTDPKLRLLGGNGKVHIQLDCALQEGDKIRTTIENQNIAYTTSDSRSTTNYFEKGTAKELTITKDHVLENASEIYLWSASSSDGRLISLEVIRPEKLAVTFNMHGHGTQVEPQNILEGGKVTEPATTDITGWDFGGWYKTYVAEPESYSDAWDFANDVVSAATELHAKWTEHVASSDATLSSLTVNGEAITLEDGVFGYAFELPMGTTALPTIVAVPNDSHSKGVSVVQTNINTATITVTAEDDSFKDYTISFTVATSKDIELVWDKSKKRCDATTPAAVVKSDDATVSAYINKMTFTGGGEGSSLNVGNTAGNMVTLTAKPGYAISAMSFYGKIEADDAKLEYSLNGGAWTDLASTNAGDACYADVFTAAEVHELRMRSAGNKGFWIRNMQLTMIEACTPIVVAWDEEPVEFEVGKAGYAIAATANNGGTISYASADNTIIDANASTGALTIAGLGSVALSASTPEGDGSTYCANGGDPIVLSKVVNTYYLVKFDGQNGEAADEVKYFSGDAAIALPAAPSYPGYDFQGWFDAETGGNQYMEAIIPTASITVYAQWVAQCDGATITTQPVGASYLTGRTPVALVCEATAGAGGALTYEWFTCDDAMRTNPVAATATPSTAVAGTFYYFCKVTEEGCAVEAFSDVATIVVADKDPICLIATTVTGATAHGAVTGFLGEDRGGDAEVNVTGGSYKMDRGKYIGVTLPDGYKFQEGDKVVLNVMTVNNATGFTLFDGKDGEKNLIIDTRDGNLVPAGANTVVLPAYAGSQSVYVMREDNSTTGNLNSAIDAIAVYRTCAPILNKVTVAGVEGAPDNTNHVAIEVPASTADAALEAIAYDWVSNDASWIAAHAPAVENAWEWGVENTVTFVDKDGDESVYYITISKAVPSSDATLSALSYGGTAIALADGVFEYNVELPYGTSAVPALAATAHHVGASVTEINNAAEFVNRHATSTVTVTAEDGTTTQGYTVNFVVSRYESKLLWDGSTMTALSEITAAATAAGVSVTTTGISVTSFSAKTCEENGKSYPRALDFGGKTQSTRYFGIVIPAGKVAKVSLVYRAKGTSRSIMVATALSSAIDESTITSKDAVDASNLYVMKADMFGGGTLYINTTDGFHVHEISIQLADGYGRSAMLGNGVLGTVCVDHNVAVEDIQGVTVYELVGREPQYGKVAFDEIISGELEAGAPYVFQAHGNHMALLYGETSVAEPVDKGNGMYGTFVDQTLTELNDIYYFAQRALWSCVDLTSLSLPANRAYVKLSEIDYISDPNPAPGRRRVMMSVNGKNTPTALDEIRQEQSANSQKLLINGQLFILRGEKMYDATGRLVK